jgi:hypothetical protein
MVDATVALQRTPTEILLADHTQEKRKVMATPKLPPRVPKLVTPVHKTTCKPMWMKQLKNSSSMHELKVNDYIKVN